MANHKKTYFLTPSFDYPPTGPILLGNILKSPETPDQPLNAGSSRVQPLPESLITSVKTDWKSTNTISNSASVGLYAKFLATILGAGVDVSKNWEREKENVYAFDRIETVFFDPRSVDGYLENALRAPKVLEYLKNHWRHKSVYMVTGVKIVRGGKVKTIRKKGHGGTLGVGFDGTALAAPVEVGPEVEVQRKKGEGVEWSGSDDFIFAYRLSRLKVKEKVEEKEYTKGALYGLKRGSDDEQELAIDDFEGDEAIADEFESEEKENADDEGEECVCIMP